MAQGRGVPMMATACERLTVAPALQAGISPFEEMELRWFFGLDLPPMPGTTSSFRAMCTQLQQKNRRTKERPSDGTPWTQILKCKVSHDGTLENAAEDAMLDYLDAQRRPARIRATLRTLSAVEYAVLDARFGQVVVD